MNQDQVLSILRNLVPPMIAYAAGKGLLPASMVSDLSAALITLGATGWGIYTHTTSSKVAAIEALGAKAIVVPPTAAPALKAIANDPARPMVVSG